MLTYPLNTELREKALTGFSGQSSRETHWLVVQRTVIRGKFYSSQNHRVKARKFAKGRLSGERHRVPQAWHQLAVATTLHTAVKGTDADPDTFLTLEETSSLQHFYFTLLSLSDAILIRKVANKLFLHQKATCPCTLLGTSPQIKYMLFLV